MLRTTAQDCWSAGIGGSGEWRGPPATSEARETVDYRPCIGPLSVGDPATSRRPRAARAVTQGPIITLRDTKHTPGRTRPLASVAR